MNSHLEQILKLESVNANRIHLFLMPGSEKWLAYEQSALNLLKIVPEVEETMVNEVFADDEIMLRRVSLSLELTERYSLPYLCTLLGDDYIELALDSSLCEERPADDMHPVM